MSLRLEFCEDTGHVDKHDIEFNPGALKFNSNDSIKQLTLTNISSDDSFRNIYFRPLENQRGPFKQSAPIRLHHGHKATIDIQYQSRSKMRTDKVVVNVDGKPVFINVSANVKGLTELDFGCIVVNPKTIEGEITLVNIGSKSKEFKFEYKGSQPIVIKPTTGSVLPHGEQRIIIELEIKHPGKIKEKVDVTLGYETKSVHVLATLNKPRDMLAKDSEDITSPSAMENVDNVELPKTAEDPDKLK